MMKVMFVLSALAVVVSAVPFEWNQINPIPRSTSHSAALAVRGLLFNIGGCGNTDCPTAKIFYFDVSEPRGWTQFPDLAVPVAGQTTSVYINSTIYVFSFASLYPTNDLGVVQSYSLKGDSTSDVTTNWTVCRAPTNGSYPIGRIQSSVVVFMERIFVVGGVNPTGDVFDQVLEYIPETCEYRYVMDLPYGWGRRSAAICSTLTGIFYIGGLAGADSFDSWSQNVIDLHPDTKTSNTNQISYPLPWPTCATIERRLWLTGNKTDGTTETMWYFDQFLEEWSASSEFAGLIPLRSAGGFTAVSNQLYLVGGMTDDGTITNAVERVVVLPLPSYTLPTPPNYVGDE